jgi:multidrug efflux pump subunit AcrA (membrane-fusion protein)
MKIPRIRKQILVPGLVVLAAAIFFLRPPRAVQVAGVELKPQDALETVLATGRVVGEKTIPLAFPRPGRLARVLVENGDWVKDGQLLMQLENDRELNARAQAKTGLDVAKLGLERAATIDLVDAREKVKQAEATAAYAEANFKRQSELLAQNTVTAFQSEQAKKERDLAVSGLEAARNQLKAAEESQKPLAALRVEQAAADLRRAETDYGETFLRAPFDGQIVEHLADKGEFVQAGQKVVTFIPDTPRTYAEIQADETNAGKFVLGQKAVISSPAFPGKTYPASVERIGSIVDAQRGTFTVRLVTDKLEPELLPESSASVQIVIGEAKAVLLLEQRFLVREAGAATVFIADGSRAKRVPVSVTDLGNGLFGIASGLSSGSIVLLPQGLRDGARVKINLSAK